jgi:hypothetical protein
VYPRKSAADFPVLTLLLFATHVFADGENLIAQGETLRNGDHTIRDAESVGEIRPDNVHNTAGIAG